MNRGIESNGHDYKDTVRHFSGLTIFSPIAFDQIRNHINRLYLINFNIAKEIEHYFARKPLVYPVIPIKYKLLVPGEKANGFLKWLDNR
jgi:hypothetical protein